MSIICSYYN
ncbi:unnamed protein product [Callosobruchus maculatus]|uniref:Uncharacterized protein n=1 Tax=Callosobruchus maculatus TaxID=64391 RepID=A0A653DWH5_CALMS|nr:unnamed protein product [Callosobruchus maculatus]